MFYNKLFPNIRSIIINLILILFIASNTVNNEFLYLIKCFYAFILYTKIIYKNQLKIIS